MNNIYIGNRYVPVFANPVEWDNLRAYEALTIVTYNGTAYTSRQPVPIGTPLSNTDYWVVTGNYNAQVEEYRQEVATLSGTVNTLDSRIDTLEDKVESNTSQIRKLGGMNKVIFIGDSYSVREDNKLPKGIASRLGLSSSDYVISVLGSTGFAHANDGTTFQTLLSNVVNRFTATDVTHVIVLGGANDTLESEASVGTAINAFKSYVASNLPNAKVYCGFIAATTNPVNIKTYGDMAICYKRTIENSNIGVYLNNVEYVLHNREYINVDAVHPTTDGLDQLIKQCYVAIKNGSCDVYYTKLVSPSIGQTTFNIYQVVHNGVTSVYTNRTHKVAYAEGSRITLPNTGLGLDYLDISSGLVTGSNYEDCAVTVPCEVFSNGGSTKEVTSLTIIVYNGHLYLRLNTHYDISGVNLLVLPQFNIEFPSIRC